MVSSCFLFGPPKKGGGGKKAGHEDVGLLMRSSDLKRVRPAQFTVAELAVRGAGDIPLPLLDEKSRDSSVSCAYAASSVGILLECMAQGRVVEHAVKKIDLAGWVGLVCDRVESVEPDRFDVTTLRNGQGLLAAKGSREVSVITAFVKTLNESLVFLRTHRKQEAVDQLVAALRKKLPVFRREVACESSGESCESVPLAAGGPVAAAGDYDSGYDDEHADMVAVSESEIIDALIEGFSLCVNGITKEMLETKHLSEEGQIYTRFIYDWIGFLRFKILPFRELAPIEKASISGGVYYCGLNEVKRTLQSVLAFAKYSDSSRVTMGVHASFKGFLRDSLCFLSRVDSGAFLAVVKAFISQKVPEIDEDAGEAPALVKKGAKKPLPKSRRDKKIEARAERKARADEDFFAWLEETGSREFYNSLMKK